MNYLAHLFFSPLEPAALAGGLLADFITVPDRDLDQRFGAGIAQGVRRHRMLDSVTDSHPATLGCVKLLFSAHRHVARIIVDICFDHFLVCHWNRFSKQSLDDFLAVVHQMLGQADRNLPEHFLLFLQRLIQYDILRGYGALDGVAYACSRMKLRLRCENRLECAGADIQAVYNDLELGAVQFLAAMTTRHYCGPYPVES